MKLTVYETIFCFRVRQILPNIVPSHQVVLWLPRELLDLLLLLHDLYLSIKATFLLSFGIAAAVIKFAKIYPHKSELGIAAAVIKSAKIYPLI